jgi:hypothetical protein
MRQMLSGMRANVESRLEDRPRTASVGRRVGIGVAIVALLGLGTASGALALGMIPHPFAAAPVPTPSAAAPAPATSSSPSSARITPTPEPTPSATSGAADPDATASIPTSCAAAVSASDGARIFGDLVRQEFRPHPTVDDPDYYVDPEQPFKEDASLVCRWSPSGSREEPDNLFLEEGTADRTVLAARLVALAAQGHTCSDRFGGRVCQVTESGHYYDEPLSTTTTFFVRGDTYVAITQTNVPTDGLLAAIVEQTWGD